MYSIHADSSIVWFQYEWVGPSHTWTGTCTMAMSLRWIGPMRHTKNTQKSPTTPRELTEKQNSWAKKHSWEHPSQKAKWFFLWCQEITYGENKIPLQKAPDSSNRISTLRPKETIPCWALVQCVQPWLACKQPTSYAILYGFICIWNCKTLGSIQQWSRVCCSTMHWFIGCDNICNPGSLLGGRGRVSAAAMTRPITGSRLKKLNKST